MIVEIPTLDDKYCVSAESYSGSYHANKIYLGRRNSLSRETVFTVEWIFKDADEQEEFFTWWSTKTDSGALPFYIKLPYLGDHIDNSIVPNRDFKYYLVIQADPWVQSVYPEYKIGAQFMLFSNKTKDHQTAPLANDVGGVVEEGSANNILLLDAVDPDNTGQQLQAEMVGAHAGIVVNGMSVNYTPTAGFIGTKTFRYRVSDGVLWSNNATLTIIVSEVDAPIAYDMVLDVVEGGDGAKNFRRYALNGFDFDGKPLTYSVVTDVTNKATPTNVIYNGTQIAFHPKRGYIGPDQLTYKCNNGVKDSNIGIVKVNFVRAKSMDIGDSFKYKHIKAVSGCNGKPREVRLVLPKKDTNGIELTYTVIHTSPPAGPVESLINEADNYNGGMRSVIFLQQKDASFSGIATYTVSVTNGITTESFDCSVEYFTIPATSDRYKSLSVFDIYYSKDFTPNAPIPTYIELRNEVGDTVPPLPTYFNDREINQNNTDGTLKITEKTAPSNGSIFFGTAGAVNCTENDLFYMRDQTVEGKVNNDEFVVTVEDCNHNTFDITVRVHTK